MRTASVALAISSVLFAAHPAFAQEWPSEPIRMIVGYPAGGNTDITARILAEELSNRLDTPVVVENRAGASGMVGASEVVNAPPDGYTMFLAASPEIAIAPAIGREMPYDPRTDLDPVSLLCVIPQMLVVNAAVPVDSVRELIALAKERPGELNYGSFGVGTSNNLVMELFKAETGIEVKHIPFRGSAPAKAALLANRVQMTFDMVAPMLPYIKSGDVKALGFASDERSAVLPDVPTMDEAGVPGFVGGSWNGILVPAGTPPEIIQRLSKEIAAAVSAPKVKEAFAKLGLPCDGSTPEKFAAFIDREIQKWSEVAERAGIEAE